MKLTKKQAETLCLSPTRDPNVWYNNQLMMKINFGPIDSLEHYHAYVFEKAKQLGVEIGKEYKTDEIKKVLNII